MNELWIVRFVRKDGKPDEEYYYRSLAEAEYHIRLPSGNWKSHKEDTVDWNEQYHAEEWRHGWELVQKKFNIH